MILLWTECCCQSFPQWGDLKKGRYEIGYADTVIFKNDEQFSYFSYQGNKPFFISIWYPSFDVSKVPYMLFKDYFNFKVEMDYRVLLDSLKKAFHSVFIESGICINITPRDSIVNVPFSPVQKRLYEDALNTIVGARYHLPKPTNKFPCILYHHGAQSGSFDNNVFCEYMASQGYVVISSNFNLPDETGRDLLTPVTDERFNYLTDFQFVIEFAKKLAFVDSTEMIAVGHSLGAQVALLYDNQAGRKPFQKIVALHTTLESRSLVDARKFWPGLSYLFDNQALLSITPTFVFAPPYLTYRSGKDPVTNKTVIQKITTIYPGFAPFRNNTSTPYTFITLKQTLKHDGFISLGHARFPLLLKYELTDSTEIKKQQGTYEKLVKLTEAIVSTKKRYYKATHNYQSHFMIESVNHSQNH